jgi:Uma2 family endonuclease
MGQQYPQLVGSKECLEQPDETIETIIGANGEHTTIYYPETDGEPVAESDFQLNPLIYAVSALRIHFQDRPDVYVSGNMLVYYKEGDPTLAVAPDVFVVFGVPKRDRRIFKIWAEKQPPIFFIEITSRKTRKKDEKEKPKIYRDMGVQEYVQYDPTGDYLKPPLKGTIFTGDGDEDIVPVFLPDGTRCLPSRTLGLELRLEDKKLRIFDPAQNRYLLSHEEAEAAWHHAEAIARGEAEARQRAEAIARGEAEARQRAETIARGEAEARQRAETIARGEAEARQRAETIARGEAEARQRAEERIKELEEQLAHLRTGTHENGKQEP